MDQPTRIDDIANTGRPLNLSQIRRQGWTAEELGRATSALAMLVHG
jgi:hypothetical protein